MSLPTKDRIFPFPVALDRAVTAAVSSVAEVTLCDFWSRPFTGCHSVALSLFVSESLSPSPSYFISKKDLIRD